MPFYIFVTGGVISGLGKGVTAASLGVLLEQAGYNVTAIKIDPYLNLDAGTMNPVIHGETFVTKDGLETDQDIGHYERFLNKDLLRLNYMTSGQVFTSVIENERQMKYQGECVEMIRHIPEEIITRLKRLTDESQSEIVIAEIGGTVGDIQNMLYLEAVRQLRLKNPGQVMVIHVVYLPLPKNLGELKTKPAQQSVSLLLAAGVQPDLIVTRSEQELDEPRREKISVFCNVQKEQIFSNLDQTSVYLVPEYLAKQNVVNKIKKLLSLPERLANKNLQVAWQEFTTHLKNSTKLGPKIGIVGKYIQSGEYFLEDAYVCVLEALKQAYYYSDLKPNITWLNSGYLEKEGDSLLKDLAGVIVPQGWGSRGTEGKILTAKYARENKVPYLGLCFGMQMAVIEFARNVLGYLDANSTEVDPKTTHPVIHIMEDQKEYLAKHQYGGTIRLGAWPAKIKSDTKLWKIYSHQFENQNNKLEEDIILERHRHRYEFNQKYLAEFEKNGLIASALSPDGKLVEAIELKDHPFFIGVQYHPEYQSRPLSVHPLFTHFLNAILEK